MWNQKARWTLKSVAVVVAATSLVGCGKKATYIDPQRGEGIVTVDQINIQDFNSSAARLTQKMLNSVNFQDELRRISKNQTDGTKPLILITNIKNDSRYKFNSVHMLAGPIEEALQESGKVEFVTQDQGARDVAKAQDILNDSAPKMPDLMLYGWIDELPVVAGNMHQSTYIFHLKLAGARGTTIWQGQEQVTKQGTKPSVGF